MGMNPRQFTSEQLARNGIEKVGRRLRKALGHSLSGYFWLWLDGVPPTATHHDKTIARRKNGVGRWHSTLANSPALVAAWDWYLARVPERQTLVPLRPPVVLAAVFRWPLPPDAGEWPPMAEYGGPHTEKPDLDNSLKVVKDVLALRGYLVDDAHVSRDGGSDKRWCEPNQRPGVLIMGRTLLGKYDPGQLFQPDAGDPAGIVHPLWFRREPNAPFVPKVDGNGRFLLSPHYTPDVATVTIPADLPPAPDPDYSPPEPCHCNGAARNGHPTTTRTANGHPRSNGRGAAKRRGR